MKIQKETVIPDLTSIIILAHNQWDQTELCLKSIERHTPEPHEIIMVDNGSRARDDNKARKRLQALMLLEGNAPELERHESHHSSQSST